MKTANNYVKQYNLISEDMKYVSNSIIRLKVLTALYEKPSNMKELTLATDLNYSSISSILQGLELKNMVYRKSNRYYIITSIELQMKNMLQLSKVIELLDEIFNIIEDHIVDNLPKESILELYLLEQSTLIESEGINANIINDLIESALKEANSVRCILPVYSPDINNMLNELVDNGNYVELKVSQDLFDIYHKKSKAKYISTFKGENNFLLIVTNKMMILGFFRNDGIFDKNRALVSISEKSLRWAGNLFKYSKKLNK